MTEPNRGRVTIPTDMDVVPETLKILDYWGADAIRDCDGTEFPEALKDTGAKIYSTYYTTRKDNAWAKANPDEVQQCSIMTGFHTAVGETLSIPLMQGVSDAVSYTHLDVYKRQARNSSSTAAASHRSMFTKGTLCPAMRSTRRRASSQELYRLSATRIS